MFKTLFLVLLIQIPDVLIAQSWIEQAKQNLKNARDDREITKANQELFYAYVFSYPDSALPFAQRAILLAKKIKSDSALSLAYHQYGDYASLTGDYPTALKFGLDALALAEHTGDFMLIGSINAFLADLYISQFDFEKAVWYGEKAKSLYDAKFTMPVSPPIQLDDTLLAYSNIAYKLAEAYVNTGQLDSALKNMRIVEFGWAFRPVKWPTELYTYGNIYYKKQDYQEAIKYYQRAVLSGFYYDLKKDLMDIYNSLSKTYNTIHQWDSGIYYGNKVLEISRSAIYPSGKLKALELLANSYKAKNNIDSTAKYFEWALSTKDSLFSRSKIAQLQNLVFNDQLRRQEIQEEQQKKIYRSRLYTLTGGLVLLIIFIYVLYRNNRQKQKAKEEIEKAYEQLKATQGLLIQSEKMASLGELTAGIAHEIQNPLNFVNNFSEVNSELIKELKNEAIKGNLTEVINLSDEIDNNSEKITHHGKRADGIVKSMLQHSRSSEQSGKLKKEPTDINALADEYLRLAYHGLRAKDQTFNATLKTYFDNSIGLIQVIPQDIARAILNLITNAFYAVQEKGKKMQLKGESFSPTVSVTTKRLGNMVEIRVKDNGPGIPQNVLDKIFQPFFTTKPTGQGTGLGLSLAYDIVKAHGGELKVLTTLGEGLPGVALAETGSEFIIQLPA